MNIPRTAFRKSKGGFVNTQPPPLQKKQQDKQYTNLIGKPAISMGDIAYYGQRLSILPARILAPFLLRMARFAA